MFTYDNFTCAFHEVFLRPVGQLTVADTFVREVEHPVWGEVARGNHSEAHEAVHWPCSVLRVYPL
jgi:hypothetical protein